jgi:hypothetical protein
MCAAGGPGKIPLRIPSLLRYKVVSEDAGAEGGAGAVHAGMAGAPEEDGMTTKAKPKAAQTGDVAGKGGGGEIKEARVAKVGRVVPAPGVEWAPLVIEYAKLTREQAEIEDRRKRLGVKLLSQMKLTGAVHMVGGADAIVLATRHEKIFAPPDIRRLVAALGEERGWTVLSVKLLELNKHMGEETMREYVTRFASTEYLRVVGASKVEDV